MYKKLSAFLLVILITSCNSNGALIKRYENDNCQGEPQADQVQWGFCFEGRMKMNYRSKNDPLPTEEAEEIQQIEKEKEKVPVIPPS